MKINKPIIVLFVFALIISFMIGVSYAYFSPNVVGNDTASSNIMISGTLRLTYNGTDHIDMGNKEPGDFDSMTFTVKNTGTLPMSGYDIYFSNVINTFYTKSELVYEIDCTSSDAVPCLDKVETEVPSVSGVAINQTDIAPGTTHTYTLTVTFIETGLNQDYNQGKTILFDVTINEQYSIPVLIAATYEGDPTWDTVGYFWDYKANITSVTFEKGIDIPVGAVASWDVSAAQDGSIMAYIIGAGTYDLYIQTESDFLLSNPNSSYLFYYFTNLTAINNISMLRTYYVTNMDSMFGNSNDLTSLNLSLFYTSSVTTVEQMFSNCSSLTSLDVSSFDTSSITTMYFMFNSCSSLTSLDVSTFDTSNVTMMANIFSGCSGLTSIDVSSFDTSNVYAFDNMFGGCSSLTSLDLSAFDTSSAVNMNIMFYNCSSLTTLDLSNFDTSNVQFGMYAMFSGCTSLTTLNLSSFDTSKVIIMMEMFKNCSALTNLDFRLADFTTVTTYTSMFTGITNGITIIVLDSTAQTWITARLTDAGKTGTVVIA